MNNTSKESPPKKFWIISIVALIWNLFGVLAYLGDVTLSAEALTALPSAEQALYANTPTWATSAYAIAVFGGLLGCIGLPVRKKWAAPLFAISLVGLVVQIIHGLFLTNAMEVYGRAALIMPVVILVVGGFLVWFSRDSIAKGWLA